MQSKSKPPVCQL